MKTKNFEKIQMTINDFFCCLKFYFVQWINLQNSTRHVFCHKNIKWIVDSVLNYCKMFAIFSQSSLYLFISDFFQKDFRKCRTTHGFFFYTNIETHFAWMRIDFVVKQNSKQRANKHEFSLTTMSWSHWKQSAFRWLTTK